MTKHLSLAETAAVLSRTEKTVRALVRRGELKPLPRNGGQGVAYRFAPEEVEAYKRNGNGGELLARFLGGFVMGRIGPSMRHPATWPGGLPQLPPGTVTESKTFDASGQVVRRVSLAHDEYLSWGRKVARVLSRREVDYLCAVLVAAAQPERKLDADRVAAHWLFYGRLNAALSTLPADQQDYAFRAFVGARDAADFGDMRRTFKTYFPAAHFPEGPMRAVIADARRLLAARKRRDQFPSRAEVGRVLGLKRDRAAQLHRAAFAKLRTVGLLHPLVAAFAPGA